MHNTERPRGVCTRLIGGDLWGLAPAVSRDNITGGVLRLSAAEASKSRSRSQRPSHLSQRLHAAAALVSAVP